MIALLGIARARSVARDVSCLKDILKLEKLEVRCEADETELDRWVVYFHPLLIYIGKIISSLVPVRRWLNVRSPWSTFYLCAVFALYLSNKKSANGMIGEKIFEWRPRRSCVKTPQQANVRFTFSRESTDLVGKWCQASELCAISFIPEYSITCYSWNLTNCLPEL